MNNIWTILIAVGIVVGLGGIAIMGGLQGPPSPITSNALGHVISAYQRDLYPIMETGAIVEAPPYAWMAAFAPGQVLKVEGRMLYGGHFVPYVTYRALSGKYQYPFLLQFDLNGDGVFSDNESLLFTGNPSMTAPMRLPTYLQGVKGATSTGQPG